MILVHIFINFILVLLISDETLSTTSCNIIVLNFIYVVSFFKRTDRRISCWTESRIIFITSHDIWINFFIVRTFLSFNVTLFFSCKPWSIRHCNFIFPILSSFKNLWFQVLFILFQLFSSIDSLHIFI
jgi:hypothetical protein